MTTEQDINAIGICTLLDTLLFNTDDTDVYGSNTSLTWEEECKLVNEWATKNNYYVYSRCKEDFFESEAYTIALQGEYDGIIFDNLS